MLKINRQAVEISCQVQCTKQPPEVFYKKTVLKNFAIFTGKHLCWSLFLNKVTGLQVVSLQHRCFPVNIAKFVRALALKNISEHLLLNVTRTPGETY